MLSPANYRKRVRICVEGYDTSLPADDIKKALTNHFRSCGEILGVDIHTGPVTDALDRCAFVNLLGADAEEKALALNGSDVGGWKVVAKAIPIPILRDVPFASTFPAA